jgi:putative lipoic acid-binding regulatory protein
MNELTTETLLEFPCEFPIKVFGAANESFRAKALTIIQQHTPFIDPRQVSCKPSKGGKYIAITVTIHAESKTQLDAIYMDLTQCPDVVMAL